jgi:hypothetical protein
MGPFKVDFSLNFNEYICWFRNIIVGIFILDDVRLAIKIPLDFGIYLQEMLENTKKGDDLEIVLDISIRK